MTLKCKNCSMNEQCICDPTADECSVRIQAYNKAIDDLRVFSDKLEYHHNLKDDWHYGFRACISKYKEKAEKIKKTN